MPNSKKPDSPQHSDATRDNPQHPDEKRDSPAPAAADYRHRNSGRRASGHGGGDMDAPEEFPEAHHKAGYDFSAGGRGHEPNRSLAHESDEDLESRSGPYTRAGRAAKPRDDPDDKKT